MESSIMKQLKMFSAFFGVVLLLGCAATSTREGTGEYVDDSAITTKVKSAMIGSSGLKSTDIGVETFKGVVQLSGFVDSQAQMSQAINGAALAPHLDVHVMKLPQHKSVVRLAETPKPKPGPEKALESWEGEGGKVAPAEDARAGCAEPGTRRT
jgi:hypothetical protein